VRYVFVETNFVVELLRPLPASAATALLDLHLRGQVSLLLPWCCASEARRTLDRVISEDLGFRDKMMRFAAVEYQRNPGGFDKSAVDFLRSVADSARVEAIQTIDARIADLVAKVSVIPPSEAVVRRTLGMFAVKALKPFDEMVAGAVLHRAQELHDAGERDLHFCDLDRDLAAQHPPLAAAYAGCGLNVVQSFVLP
jgi:hypothetical protein